MDITPSKAEWQIYATEDALTRWPLDQLENPPLAIEEEHDRFRMRAAVERFVRLSIADYDARRYGLVGWYESTESRMDVRMNCELFVVVEDFGIC
jgi:hypothetical protein